MTILPDHQLVVLARAGSPDATAILYERHHRYLLSQSRTYAGGDVEPEDLVQETWLRILGDLHRFTPTRSFRSWAVTILRNLGRDTATRRTRRSDLLQAHRHDLPEPPEAEVYAPARERRSRLLYETLDLLSTRQRIALMLHVGQKCPSGEVGRDLGCKPQTVRTTCYFALERVRREFARRMGRRIAG